MSKRKASASQEDESPAAKTSSIEESIDYFKEHFCQNLTDQFAKQLQGGVSSEPQKVRLNAIDNKHSAQYFDNGFELVSQLRL
jgi:hypothetical protein